MKADLAIYTHVLGVHGQYESVALMLSHKMDFNCCANRDGFRKSSHIYALAFPFDLRCESVIIIGCNTTARGLTDIYARSRGHTTPEGECGYISKTLSTSVLQHLCNIFNSRVLHCL